METFEAYLAQVADFADQAAAAGVIVSLRLWNRGYDAGRNDFAVEYLHSRFSDPWEANSRGFRLRDRLFLEWGDRFQWPDKNAPDMGGEVFCYGMKDQFGILCDGTVVPCCLDSDGVIALGNVFTQELGEILASPRVKAMTEGFSCRKATEDLCRRCGYARRF
jgi:radical SAM protein with 4Fe4S-binding SPASM domain